MIRIFKNTSKGGNGEIVIVTDAADVDAFRMQLTEVIPMALTAIPEDEEFTLGGILEKAFLIAFKLAGYKAELVHEQKLLTCGYSGPNECDLLAESDETREDH